ncbi:uncharacterized protein LOC135462570 [Liolophura sinensis]|uniref:uncharacterized protein LOC135462570 n=1 Tax=Liolophura sinensis TaxID=3198878 RepID=UPI0031593B84
MAKRRSGFMSEIQPLISLLLIGLHVSETVHITPVDEPVRAKDSNAMVILPCDFRTNSFETPQITWYQEKGTERNKIMQYDIHSRLSSYGEFLNRVGRGDRGALFLFRPTSRDSGTYTCEVEVDNENPSWTKNTVVLNITDDPLITKTCKPAPPSKDKEGTKGMIVLIAFCWISPLVCFVLYVSVVSLSKQILQRLRQENTRQTLMLAAGPVVVVVIALCLTFTGTVSTAVAMSSASNNSAKHYYDVGLGTALTGILMLFGATFFKLCVPVSLSQESNALDVEIGQTPKTLRADETDGHSSTINKRSPGKAEATSPEGTSLMSLSPFAEGRIIENPPGKVTGMVAVPNNSILLTTTSGLFQMNANEYSQTTRFKCLYSCKSDLLMVASHKDQLYILAENRTTHKKGKSEKRKILHSSLKEINFKAVEINSKSTATCIHVGQREIWLHLTVCNPAKVIRMALDNKRSETFGQNELLYPSSLVQNSSGQFIVSDPQKRDLLVFEQSGEHTVSLRSRLPKKIENEIIGYDRLAIGPDDRIYASSPLSNNILVFSPDLKFETLLATMAEKSGKISSLMVHNNSLYVAHERCIGIYPLNSE